MREIAIISGFSAFILILLRKWGVIEWLQVHGCDLVCKMASCEFCLSWWMCLVIGIAYAWLRQDFWTLEYVIPAAIVCRFFITH